jgi:DNA-binding transcriptional regulator YiaG
VYDHVYPRLKSKKTMPNIASVLKEEIARVARKEVRGETQQLKKSSTQARTDIAALKRRILSLEQQLKRLAKTGASKGLPTASKEAASHLRFSAKGLAAQRNRLKLSAAEFALLLGVSAQSIYKWEAGKARPRTSQLPMISNLRKMGKREATARLEALVR